LMEKATQRKQFSKESGRDYFLVAYGGYKKREAVFNRFPVSAKS